MGWSLCFDELMNDFNLIKNIDVSRFVVVGNWVMWLEDSLKSNQIVIALAMLRRSV